MGANCMCYSQSETRAKVQRQRSKIALCRQATDPISPSMRRPCKSHTLSLDGTTSTAETLNFVSDRKKTYEEERVIQAVLRTNFVLEGLGEEEVVKLADCMQLCRLQAKETVVTAGQAALYFYILASGKLEAVDSAGARRVLKPGESFGEVALLTDSPRAETVRTLKDSTLWVLNRHKFREIITTVNARIYAENRAFIDSVPLFQRLTSEQRESLVVCLHSASYDPGQEIVREGETGYKLFFIKTGEVTCSEAGRELKRLGVGEYFGEQALLNGNKRTATVTALQATVCLSLTHEDLLQAFQSQLQMIIFRNTLEIAFERHEFLGKLSSDQREYLMGSMDFVHCTEGQPIVAENHLHVVLSGSIVYADEALAMFSVFGSGFFEEEEEAAAYVPLSVLCKSLEADLGHISRDQFERCLGGNFHKAAANNLIIKTLKQLPIFHKLAYEQLKALSVELQVRSYRSGEAIVREGDVSDFVYFVQSGKVDIVKGAKVVRSLRKGSPLCEQSLEGLERSEFTILAKGDAVVWGFPTPLLQSLLDEDMKAELRERSLLLSNPCTLEDLQPVKLLGKGLAGTVYLTYSASQDRFYALKFLLKTRASQLDLSKALIQERALLLSLDHHMVVRLYKTFTDSKRVYFLMEYIHSQSFFSVIREIGLLNESQARFYTAACIEILAHLQEREIVHRDIKPENLLIDANGYPTLIDLSTAKKVQGRTYSVTGTPYYMAPEVIKGKGYGPSADLWSLGIMLYEMVYGYVPFGEDSGDPVAVYQQVLAHNLHYPEFTPQFPNMHALIAQLLSLNPALRSAGSLSNLRTHKFFRGFAWVLSRQDRLRCRDLEAPFLPMLQPLESPASTIETLDDALYVRIP